MDAKAAASAKPGLEESAQSALHRIRITLTSTKTKALEQGTQLPRLCRISNAFLLSLP